MTALVVAAFAAGMVATVNPCGFAMLPAYLGLFIGERGSGRGSALLVGASVSTGFASVFVLSGLLIATGVRFIVGWLPWLALAIGVGLIVLGLAELGGLHVFARLPGVRRSSRDRSFWGLVGFGAAYGVASLSCTLPIFLSLIAGAVASGSVAESFTVFVAYGVGMSLVVISLTLALAVGRDRVLKAIRPIGAYLGTISGWVLILAGGFVVFYWATVLASGAAALGANAAVRFVERLSAGAAGLVSANPLLSTFIVVGLGAAAWWSIRPGRKENNVPNKDGSGVQAKPTIESASSAPSDTGTQLAQSRASDKD